MSAPGAAVPSSARPAAIDLTRLVRSMRRAVARDLEEDQMVLPALPDVVLRLRQLLNDPDHAANEVTELLSTDAALSAHVLRIANSAVYAGMPEVTGLHRAVVRLGSRSLGNTLMLLVVTQMYNAPRGAALKQLLARQWNHSTLVASLADVLCVRCTTLERWEAVLAGIIHDIGALPVLARCARMRGIMRNEALMDAVARALHTEVGEALLTRWGFSPALVRVAAEHEDLDRAPGDPDGGADLIDVIAVANLMARRDDDHPLAELDWKAVPAMARLGLDAEAAAEIAEEGEANAVTLQELLGAGR